MCEMVSCDACEGTGSVRVFEYGHNPNYDYEDGFYSEILPCRMCGGTGKIKKEAQPPKKAARLMESPFRF